MAGQRSVTSLLTGASATIIVLTTGAVFALLGNSTLAGQPAGQIVWPMLVASSCATLLVMSLLHGDLQSLCGSLVDAERRAQEAARRDDLTGLGNRKYLFENLTSKIAQSNVVDQTALLLIDLDNIKRVNDTLGHSAGDQLINAVAERLRIVAQDSEIARLGGDEFALIVSLESADVLPGICSKIVSRLTEVVQLDQGECFISGSVGATILEEGLSASESMRRADLAMYRAKGSPDGFRIYDQSMSDEAHRRTSLATALRKSLASRDGLSTKYQAIMAPSGATWGVEALLRWEHREFGQVPTLEIISVAEEMHLINEIGLFVAEEVCKAAKLFPDLTVCLNIAALQLLDFKFSSALHNVLLENGVPPEQIQLEIRERDIVDRAKEIEPALLNLSRLGFIVAVDDFGSSTSSLVQLQKMGVTVLKLDQNVLENAREMGSIAVMRAKVTLAKSLGMRVICEGINDLTSETAAVQSGCDFLQGYRYGRPVPLASFAAEQLYLGQRTASAAR